MTIQLQPAIAQRVPPEVFFVASAIFHYVGPAWAFADLEPIGVAWLSDHERGLDIRSLEQAVAFVP